MIKKEKGITLIALVITIIVLLILAGITIASLSGENGILTRAQEARNKTIEAQEQEEQTLKEMEDYMDEVLEGEEPIEPTDIYVTLYTDGTLGFSNNSEPISGKEVSKTYNNIKGQDFEINWDENTVNTPWYGDVASVKTVEISNKIAPTDMDGWFFACTELTEI